MSYKFIQNKECEWFPCHSASLEDFNCLFCFCPLYLVENCGGQYKTLQNGVKDCSDCMIPHENYDYIINRVNKLIFKKNV